MRGLIGTTWAVRGRAEANQHPSRAIPCRSQACLVWSLQGSAAVHPAEFSQPSGRILVSS